MLEAYGGKAAGAIRSGADLCGTVVCCVPITAVAAPSSHVRASRRYQGKRNIKT